MRGPRVQLIKSKVARPKAVNVWGSSVALTQLSASGVSRELVRLKLSESKDVTLYLSLEPSRDVDNHFLKADIAWGSGGRVAMTETVDLAMRGQTLHYVADEITVRARSTTSTANAVGRVLASAGIGRPIERYRRAGTGLATITSTPPEYGRPIINVPPFAAGVIFESSDGTAQITEGSTPPDYATWGGTGSIFRPHSGSPTKTAAQLGSRILWLATNTTAVRINGPVGSLDYDLTWVSLL